MIRASAPGKLVILGEYAVLAGAPGLVSALPRRALVTLRQADHSGWRVRTPPLDDTWQQMRWQPDGRLTTQDGNGIALLDAAVRQFPGQQLPEHGIDLALDTRAFHAQAGGQKLGIGSSAALCTALTGALAALAKRQTDLATALAVHREFQSGAGSGIDVAASWSGGTLAFWPGDPPRIEPLRWPADLHALVVFTGQSASTTGRLERLNQFAGANAGRYQQLMQPLIQTAQAAPAALSCAADFVTLAGEFSDHLRILSDAAGLEVWTAGHQHLDREARSFGLLYKTSGAGGGDCGLALATDADRISQFADNLSRQRIDCWKLQDDPQGLKVSGPGQGG